MINGIPNGSNWICEDNNRSETERLLLMESSIDNFNPKIAEMVDLIKRIHPNPALVDFYEEMSIQSVRSTLRLWKSEDQLEGFAYVDDYNNLRFETDPSCLFLEEMEREIVEWGVLCMKKRNAETGTENSLDYSCSADESHLVYLMDKYGFIPQSIRSLQYSRPIDLPVNEFFLPEGFSIRPVQGKSEVGKLVALHQVAFRTSNMTVEQRTAMMSVPQYEPELDLVAVAPNGELAAFCVCGFDDPEKQIGYTDPIGTHPDYRRIGLGKAIVSTGMQMLKTRGAKVVELGTSSENIAMQGLAETLGFVRVSERIWFSKTIC